MEGFWFTPPEELERCGICHSDYIWYSMIGGEKDAKAFCGSCGAKANEYNEWEKLPLDKTTPM